MNPYSALAKRALQHHLETGAILTPPQDLPAAMLKKRAGVFVTIEKGEELRGCIGTFLPVCSNLAQEIIRNSIAAGTQDYRFSPVQREELDLLSFTVSLLSTPEKVDSLDDFDTRKYGMIMESPLTKRRGLLLPNLPGVNTPDQQIEICRQKGGIGPDTEEITLYRFTVIKYQD